MPRIASRRSLTLTLVVALLTGCGESTDPTLTIPATLERVSGHGQGAVAGTAIPTGVAVRVLNAHGDPLKGVTVTWSVTAGGGTPGATTSTSDAEGIASTSWTLGTTAGANLLTATVAGIDPLAFQATGTAGTPMAIEVHSGGSQTGHAGLPLGSPVVVRVEDQHGNPNPFVSVTWAVTAGGGFVNASETLTDASGLAQVTWTTGTVAGVANSLSATTAGVSPTTITATSTVGVPAIVSTQSGNGQTAVVTEELPEALVVKVTDQFGNANAAVQVSWFTFGDVTVSDAQTTTDANGITSVIATFGTVAGATSVIGEAGTASGGFVLHSTHAEPTTIVDWTGTDLSAPVGTAIALPIRAKVTDDYGNAVPDIAVTWTASPGSGTVDVLEGNTNLIGLSTVSWTLGPSPGTHTLTASAVGQSVQFTATATASGARPR